MRKLTNNITAQIEDFLLRWKVVPRYLLAGCDTGEKLEIKVRDEVRIRQLTLTNSPALVTDRAVYLSKQRVMEGMAPNLVRFIIAHEVGHWVNRHQEVPPSKGVASNTCRIEVQADNFAIDLYGHQREIVLLVRQEFEGMLSRASVMLRDAQSEAEFDDIAERQRSVISRWKNLHERVNCE